MIPLRYRVLLWIGPLVLVQWLVAAFTNDKQPGKFYEALFVGSFWGTLFGHTTLAAAWTAFGPAPFVIRLPLALLWVATLPIAIAVNLHVNAGPTGMAIPIGSTLFAQWLILQLPLWGLALGMGLHLQHRDDVDQRPGMDPPQFTLRQLFIVTAIVGVLFGLGRLLLPVVVQVGPEASIFWLLAAAELLLTLPLVLVVLLRRITIPGMLLMFVLIGTASFWQVPFLQLDKSGSVQWHVMICINVGTSLVMLSLLIAVRLNGYSLVASRSSAKA